MSLKAFTGRVRQDYSGSVIRPTILLALLVVPAFGANFLLQYSAAALFSPGDFGVFYTANTVGNVLFSGSIVLNIYFTRYLVSLQQSAETDIVFPAIRRLERVVLLWGGVVAALIFLALFGAASGLGVASWMVLLLVVLDAYTSYVTDLGRVALQSLHKAVALGLYTLGWMALRFALAIAGILLFHTVWAALAGVVTSSVLVWVGFHIWARSETGSRRSIASPPKLVGLIPFILGYGLLILISNLDILLGYFLLSNVALGFYSASSVFPKAVLLVIMPLLQMLFPMLLRSRPSAQEFKKIAFKSGGIVLALSAAGAAMVWLLSPWICGGTFGLKLCQTPPLYVLLLSVMPLAGLRILVLLQSTRGHDWLALWMALPTVIYVFVAWYAPHTIDALALSFTGFAVVTIAVMIFVQVVVEWNANMRSTRSETDAA